MAVLHPGEQRLGLAHIARIEPCVQDVEIVGGAARCGAHFRPIGKGDAHIAHAALDVGAQRREQRRVDDAVDLDVLERLEPPVPAGLRTSLLDAAQHPGCVACDRENRVRQKMDGQRPLRNREADRIDQERHVVVHHLDDGMGRCVAVLLERRVEHPHQCAATAALRELQVRQSGPREHRGSTRRHVVGIDVGVVRFQEALGVHASPGFALPRGGDDGCDRLAVLLCARLIHVDTFENQFSAALVRRIPDCARTRAGRAHARPSRCGRENKAPVGMRDYARAGRPALQMRQGCTHQARWQPAR